MYVTGEILLRTKFIVCVVLITLLFISPSYAVLDEEESMLIIAGDKNFPPYEYIDYDREYRGFNVDLMRALAIEMGIEIKLVPMDWMEAHALLHAGKIDAIQGMNFNEKRAEIYDFSDEYLVNSQVCFVKKENTNIFDLENLKGKRVAVQRSDLAAYILAEMGEIEVVFFSDLDGAFEQLINDEVDAVVGNRLSGLYNIQKNRTVNKIKIVGDELNLTPYGIAVQKGNTELLDKFNKGLQKLKRKGTYQKIYEKWFGKEIKPAWRDLKYALYTLIFIVISTLAIILVIFRLNKVLKKEVEKRTYELENINKELAAKQKIIEESDRFKEQVLDCLGNGLITFDTDGKITTINKNCEILLGLERGNTIGKQYDMIGIEKYFDISIMERSIKYGEIFNLEEKRFTLGNRELTFSYTLSPLHGKNNKHIGAVLTFRNITEIKTLRNKLAEKDKMQSLGRLISGIAHEIRNPLTSIKTYIELLPIKYDNVKFREKITQQVPAEIHRLNLLLTELLDYSKPKKLKKEKFDLEELIIQTTALFSAELSSKNIDVEYVFKGVPSIYADRQQIKQIIINLLINSIEAVDSHGKVQFLVNEDEDNLVMSIVDNGKGISEENIDNVFDPFYTTKADGTGLGLSICYQCAKDNNAQIIINSKKHQGTRIDLVFSKAF